MEERKNQTPVDEAKAVAARAEEDLDEVNDLDEEGDFDDEGDLDAGGEAPAAGTNGGAASEKADDSCEILLDLLDHMGLATEVTVREDGERIVLNVGGQDAGRAIGKKGQTLDALQFLINKIVNRFPEGRRHVVVDSGDYRTRREEGLVTMAQRQAERAVAQGSVVTLQPMSARDRRVIHLSLAKFPGVSTKSQGQGLGRRIQIIPAQIRAGSGGGAPRRDGGFRGRGGPGRGRGDKRPDRGGGREGGPGREAPAPAPAVITRRRWDD